MMVTHKFSYFPYALSIFLFGFLISKIVQIDDLSFRLYFFAGLIVIFLPYWLTAFLKKELRFNLHLFLGSFLISLFAAECAIEISRVFVPKDLEAIKKEGQAKLSVPFDRRNKFEVIQDFRRLGIKAYPSIHPHNEFLQTPLATDVSIFPLAGISHVKTILCNENGYYAEYFSDRYGFNNADKIYDNPVDIVLLGDSMIHGSCVRSEENLSHYLARQNLGTILNLGMGGNGPLIELATLVEYASLVRPKIVLWLFSDANDLTDLANEMKVSILANYLNKDFRQDLAHKQKMIDKLLINYVENKLQHHAEETSHEKFWDPSIKNILLIRHIRYRLGFFNPISRQPYLEFETVMRLSKEKVESWGGTLIVLYSPLYSKTEQVDPALAHIHKNVMDILRRLDIPVFDLKLRFSKEPDPLQYFPFRLPGHFAPKGYELLASYITDSLRQWELSS